MSAQRSAPLIGALPSGTTRVAAVIGEPVTHSLSPAIHNAGFQAAGLDWVYLAFPVPAGRAADALQAMTVLGLGGLSVTMPHKEAVAQALSGRLSGAAQRLGAVNCVCREGGSLVGHNTDGGGFVDALQREMGVDVSGATVAVVGAGGAGRAVAAALAEAGVSRLVIVNRNRTRAEHALTLVGGVGEIGDETAIGNVEIVVNATSVGMGIRAPQTPEFPFDPRLIGPEQIVADLVYQPVETGLLRAAQEAGARTLNGVGMLLYQAVRAFELWTETVAPVAAMRDAVETHLAG